MSIISILYTCILCNLDNQPEDFFSDFYMENL